MRTKSASPTYSLAEYMPHFMRGDWPAVADMLLASVQKVADCGAEFAILPCNTLHEAMPYVIPRSPIPWIHIAEPVAEEARRRNFNCLGILGTNCLMQSRVYPDTLKPMDLAWEVPDEKDRKRIDAIIFGELVNNVFQEVSRRCFNSVIQRLKDRGCDAVVLGCTEIPLLVDPTDCLACCS